ncbi:MAG: hypothetical protein L0Z07_00310 [Planctomycetes bacterium]|nr:hypothetical protein [Planctomycetota bacterium]
MEGIYRFLIAIVIAVFVAPASAEPVTYIYNAPESELDRRYVYHWKILETALERTVPKHGPFRMVASEVMTERRQVSELERAGGKLTVMYLDTTPELEKKLFPIRIPVDKSLVGYRVFLIHKDDQQRFAAVHSLDDLRAFTYGLGASWVDVEILKFNRFKVNTGSSYDGLFRMLVNRRFDILSRGASEVLGEYNARKDSMPDVHIEPNILLYYPLPMYFWFSKTDEGRQLAARAEEGMRLMIDDGTFDWIFDQFHREAIATLRLNERKLFTIENPLLVPETPFEDKRLWFELGTYRAGTADAPSR